MMEEPKKKSNAAGAIVLALVIFGVGLWVVGAARHNNTSSISPVQSVSPRAAPDTSPPTSSPAPVQTAPQTQAPAAADSKPACDPNYTSCVPNVYPADVDCAGGSGNGPYYATGPVRVIGVDRYGLDRDGDGVACE